MISALHLHDASITPCSDTFDTAPIIATINRLLQDALKPDPTTELVELTVLGAVPSQPTRLRLRATMRCHANHCLVAVPMEVDAGALRGLEAGVGVD